MRLLLLPGMDGTGLLFRHFVEALGTGIDAEAVGYPVDRSLGYDELEALVRARFKETVPTVVVAESFSGAIAVRLAADPPPGLRAVVLAAAFVAPPAPTALAILVRPILFSRVPPSFVVRSVLVGWDAPNALVDSVRAAIAAVRPEVLAQRLRAILTEDVTARLRVAQVPIACIRPSRDRLVWSYRPLLEAAPDAQCHVVDGPHLVLQRRPVACACVLRDFVERF